MNIMNVDELIESEARRIAEKASYLTDNNDDEPETVEEQKEIQKFLKKYEFRKILAQMKDDELEEHEKSGRLQKRAEDTRFRKQKDTMIKKAERMRVTFEADMFILIRRKAKIYGYCGSSDSKSTLKWPLTMDQIVSSFGA
jgi:hypothetical protein